MTSRQRSPSSVDPVPAQENIEPMIVVDEQRQQNLHQSLSAIYQTADGTLPDLSRLERHRPLARWRQMVGLAAVLLGLSLMAWLGLLAFQPFHAMQPPGLSLAIQGPSSIALGEEQTYVVEWSNPTLRPLAQAEVRITVPPEFQVEKYDPAPTDATLHAWQLGFIPVGAHGSIRLTGAFVAALGGKNTVQAVAIAKSGSLDKDLETLVRQDVSYDRSVLAGSLILPPKVLAGDMFTLAYQIVNHGSQPMTGLIGRLYLPDGFVPQTVATTTDASRHQDVFFHLDDLAVGATTTIQLSGLFSAGISGDITFIAQTGRESSGGDFLPSQQSEAHLPVLSGDLGLQMIANGSDHDAGLQPGDPLRLMLSFQNLSPETMKDLVLLLGVESLIDNKSATGTSLIHWSKIENSNGGASSTLARVQTIRYEKQQLPALARLDPQADGFVTLTLPTLPAPTGSRDVAIRLTLQAAMPTLGGVQVNRIVRAQPIVIHYRSDVRLLSEARYFTEEGAPLGQGPLPPMAGSSTTYRVFWHLIKSLHSLDHVVVSATLPKNVVWNGLNLLSAGTLSYVTSTNALHWEIADFPQQARYDYAVFDLTVTPSGLDVGRFAKLLSETNLQAHDPIVSETIQRSQSALSTDLQNDDAARNKGVVRP